MLSSTLAESPLSPALPVESDLLLPGSLLRTLKVTCIIVLLNPDRYREGLKIVLADVDAAKLEQAAKALSAEYGEANVLAVPTDVSKLDQVQALADRTLETFGEVNTDL
jgi:hypothetical protein